MAFITIQKGDSQAEVTERAFERVWSHYGWERVDEEPTGPQRQTPSQQAQKQKSEQPKSSSKKKSSSGEENG